MATVYVYTDHGWVDEDDVFTPITKHIKKNVKAIPIEVDDELTKKLQNELPMVVVKGKYYYIQSVN
ncbi:hypothetical protein SAMN05421676_101408 [Salinibacillus kushneri]|uniref:Uncharacterized protein n=1 Tax=Salinibacillus kushneri TaxID=237682 RepID=A0A1H9Z6Y6_9BACI|nr:hypothetical protein [Salinibacillus kushneri]SES77103.1 hypothetical protein SAMN05421676_101408 [Salinibacillus kushneri]